MSARTWKQSSVGDEPACLDSAVPELALLIEVPCFASNYTAVSGLNQLNMCSICASVGSNLVPSIPESSADVGEDSMLVPDEENNLLLAPSPFLTYVHFTFLFES